MLRGMRALLFAILLSASACGKDEPAENERSSGGESTYRKTLRSVNGAHDAFKEEVKPAAGWVDDKSHKAADEVRKGTGMDDDSQTP